MKTCRYIVEIEMPDGDMVSANWLKDIIQEDCDSEDDGRQIVSVSEVIEPQGLDEAPKKDWLNEYNEKVDAEIGSSCYSEKGLDEAAEEIKKLADDMYDAAMYLTTDASRLRNAMEKYHHYIVYHYYGKKNN